MTITLTRKEAQQVLDVIEINIVGVTRYKATELLRARLAQPEPKPVAWMLTELDGTPLIDCGDLVVKQRPVLVSDKTDCIPLYTAPSQREWQGLTDDEAVNMLDEVLLCVDVEFLKRAACAIEAKLKEKNT
jgi:hypothetical protein